MTTSDPPSCHARCFSYFCSLAMTLFPSSSSSSLHLLVSCYSFLHSLPFASTLQTIDSCSLQLFDFFRFASSSRRPSIASYPHISQPLTLSSSHLHLLITIFPSVHPLTSSSSNHLIPHLHIVISSSSLGSVSSKCFLTSKHPPWASQA